MTDKQRCNQSYLEGEFNAVENMGTAIMEAVSAIKGKLKSEKETFVLLEFQGIMLRSSMLIREKNRKLGIKND